MASLCINVAVKFQVAANSLFTLQAELNSLAFEGARRIAVGWITRVASVVGTYDQRRRIPPRAGLYNHRLTVQSFPGRNRLRECFASDSSRSDTITPSISGAGQRTGIAAIVTSQNLIKKPVSYLAGIVEHYKEQAQP
jgi:hypothetical protein